MSVSYGGDSITFADGSVNSSGFIGHRNRIINGAMMIDQRNAGASVTPTTDQSYTLDRWMARLSVSSKYSVQQNAGAVTPPTGFTKYLGITSLSAYTVSATDYFLIEYRNEGFNVADLAWGTASAATVTLSFWVRSSLTGTFGGAIENGTAVRSYPFNYTINAANTWEQKSVTIAGDTSGTWTTDNTRSITICIGFGAGSTYSGTAGAWAGTTYVSATGATSVVGTNGATFYITGVQLERGSTASSVEYRSYGAELALCYRYYINANYATAGSTIGMTGNVTNAVNYHFSFGFPVPMRTSPTLTWTEWTSNGFPSGANFQQTGFLGSNVYKGCTSTVSGGFFLGGYTASAEL